MQISQIQNALSGCCTSMASGATAGVSWLGRTVQMIVSSSATVLGNVASTCNTVFWQVIAGLGSVLALAKTGTGQVFNAAGKAFNATVNFVATNPKSFTIVGLSALGAAIIYNLATLCANSNPQQVEA